MPVPISLCQSGSIHAVWRYGCAIFAVKAGNVCPVDPLALLSEPKEVSSSDLYVGEEKSIWSASIVSAGSMDCSRSIAMSIMRLAFSLKNKYLKKYQANVM